MLRTAMVEGVGGVRLYTATQLPREAVRGVVYFVMGPEAGADMPYPRFTGAAGEAGFVTFMLHPRGTGRSEGARGDLRDFSLYLGDLELGLSLLRTRFPQQPVFLFGHSAGAAFALELAVTSSARLAGLVVVNPAYRLKYGDGMGPSARDYFRFAFDYLFRRSSPTVDLNPRPEAVADPADRAEAEAMRRDPHVVRFFSMRFLAAQKSVMTRCAANASRLRCPLLLVQGARDALVDPRGNDEILAAASLADATRVVAADGAHGSSAVETVALDVLAWIAARGPGSGGAGSLTGGAPRSDRRHPETSGPGGARRPR